MVSSGKDLAPHKAPGEATSQHPLSTEHTSKTTEQDSKSHPESSKESSKHAGRELKETSKPSIKDSIFISHANAPEGSGIPKHWATEEGNRGHSTGQADVSGDTEATRSAPRRSIKDSIIITHANAPRDSGIPRHWPDE
ncbi:hypothetical protein K493DRAFT_310337 [Basidiobolus meristosporus CBS 931.73]|uniref:Uncharacterized protein n=1 Tax=Basidiobolus meristosporus CBS 931.73 TaxID=1314790 RepID=A0A1Y1ZA35_9FUNG|nr:hypothetical protein K493DRAFT_310337 [Basidiobolus meristosporus CBS 931.73]|eukprot:ORY07111.1 hypothetical protein K493DRAFT_310337 [Basidiobolus meristosporus CBS 931.73]